MKTEKTTFTCRGAILPCIMITGADNRTQLRLCKFFRGNTILAMRFIDGEYDTGGEIDGDFDNLSNAYIKKIAKYFCLK